MKDFQKKLLLLADHLDRRGLTKEADVVDRLIATDVNPRSLDNFTKQYVRTALRENVLADVPPSRRADLGIEHIDDKTLYKMKADAEKFQNAHYDTIERYLDEAGEAFFAARNGDRDAFFRVAPDFPDEEAERLMEDALKFGPFHLVKGPEPYQIIEA